MNPLHSSRLSAGVFAGFAAAIALASPALAKAPPSKPWKATSPAHLRSAPSSRAPSVAVIPRNTIIAATTPCAAGWCAVEFNGKRGWVFKAYLAEAAASPARAPVLPEKPALEASLTVSPAPAEAPAPVSAPEEGAGGAYSLIGLSANGVLPMREGPLDSARVVGVLSSSASGIADLKTSVRQWRLIEHNGVKGYVHSRFLARPADAPAQRYRVEGMEGLKVLSFGGADADVVGEIPFYASGIAPIGACNAQWCHIRYLGLVGFVDMRGLRPDAEPEG